MTAEQRITHIYLSPAYLPIGRPAGRQDRQVKGDLSHQKKRWAGKKKMSPITIV